MPYSPDMSPTLTGKLKKIKKKNFVLFGRIIKKIDEVIQNPEHYKPLSYDMKNKRRVHLDPFVLTFIIKESENVVLFLDVEHHDNAYRR